MSRVLELPPPLPQPRPCSPCGRVDLAAPEIRGGAGNMSVQAQAQQSVWTKLSFITINHWHSEGH